MYIKLIFNLIKTETLSDFYKSDFNRYSPSSLATLDCNNTNIKIYIHMIQLHFSTKQFFSLQFNVTQNFAADTQYSRNAISLVNLGPSAVFKEAKVTTISDKLPEKVEDLHVLSLMHKL